MPDWSRHSPLLAVVCGSDCQSSVLIHALYWERRETDRGVCPARVWVLGQCVTDRSGLLKRNRGSLWWKTWCSGGARKCLLGLIEVVDIN